MPDDGARSANLGIVRRLGVTDYEATWHAMQAFTLAGLALTPLSAAVVAGLTVNVSSTRHARPSCGSRVITAGSAPVDAAPHFWVGCAMFAKSLQEEGAEGQLQWLTRAEDEFKLALASEPADWDTKYNYELSARLVAALRRPPKPGNKPSAIKLLRPEEAIGVKLTTGFMLDPEQSTSAIVVHHPAAKYFVV